METTENRPRFGTLGFYEAMAEALNRDEEWSEKGKVITCTMSYCYGPPIDKVFFLAFDEGRITQVEELESVSDRSAGFVIIGSPENWRAVLKREVKPATAMAVGKLRVEGKQTYLLKNMKQFMYILEVMMSLNPIYDDA